MNLKRIGINKNEIAFIKDKKDRQLIIRLRRLQNIIEYLREKYQKRVLRKVFNKNSKYINAWNNRMYVYDGGNQMIPLKKDGTKSVIGGEVIIFWTIDKWKKVEEE